MPENLYYSVIGDTIPLYMLAIITGTSLILGLTVAGIYKFRNKHSQSLATTLVLLPALVQIIIMLASGNIGVGVAVAGAFSLIRFRSIAGTAKDIGYLFFSMALGFVTGLGYLSHAVVFLVIIGGTSMLMTIFKFGKPDESTHTLRIKIPENMDYDNVFDEVFMQYADRAELLTIRTTQMGSMYDLVYSVTLKNNAMSKAFIDDLRVRNSNLPIVFSLGNIEKNEL